MLLVHMNISGSLHAWVRNYVLVMEFVFPSSFNRLLWEMLLLILVKDSLKLQAGANAAAQQIFGHTKGASDWIQDLAEGIFGDFYYCRLIWHKL